MADAPTNMTAISVTLLVSQSERSALKADAYANRPVMSVTSDTSHVWIGNAVAHSPVHACHFWSPAPYPPAQAVSAATSSALSAA